MKNEYVVPICEVSEMVLLKRLAVFLLKADFSLLAKALKKSMQPFTVAQFFHLCVFYFSHLFYLAAYDILIIPRSLTNLLCGKLVNRVKKKLLKALLFSHTSVQL